jgi:hypothetical protein
MALFEVAHLLIQRLQRLAKLSHLALGQLLCDNTTAQQHNNHSHATPKKYQSSFGTL